MEAYKHMRIHKNRDFIWKHMKGTEDNQTGNTGEMAGCIEWED